MFETLTFPSLDIMVLTARAVLLFAAFCVFALAFIRWRSADARANAQLLQQLERTFAEVRSLHETVAVMGARLEALNENTEANTRTPPPVSSSVSPRGYDIAARLAKNGAGAEALIANCGLTKQEAELMVRLHGAKVASAEPAAPRPTRVEPPRPARELRAANEARQQTTGRQEARQAEVTAASQRTASVPVLQVPSPEIRAAAGRRRGGLVSMVG